MLWNVVAIPYFLISLTMYFLSLIIAIMMHTTFAPLEITQHHAVSIYIVVLNVWYCHSQKCIDGIRMVVVSIPFSCQYFSFLFSTLTLRMKHFDWQLFISRFMFFHPTKSAIPIQRYYIPYISCLWRLK